MKRGLLLVFMILALIGCGKKKEDKKEAKAPEIKYKSIRVATIEKEAIQRNDVSSGLIDPNNEAVQVAETSGEIIKINYKNGQRVKKGAIIVEIKDQSVKSSYLSSEADLVSARSENETKSINFDKFKKLYSEKLISEDEYLSTKNAYNKSISSLRMAEANYQRAKDDYENLIMKAKLSGIVTDLDVKLFEKVNSGKELFTIVDDSIMRIKTAVSPKEISKLKVGDIAIVTPEGMTESFKGKVSEINPVADPISKKFAVKVDLGNNEGHLKKGMYSKVTLQTGKKEGLLVPLESLVVKDLYSYIFIVEEGKAKQILVTRGYAQPGKIEVLSEELPEKFEIIVEGQFLLEDKDNVKILD